MGTVAPKTRNNPSTLVWPVLIIFIGVFAGIGGYLLGKNAADDKAGTNTQSVNVRQSMQEFCSDGYCITYNNLHWQQMNQTTFNIKEYGAALDLEYKGEGGSQSPQVYFSTSNEPGLGGWCGSCYVYPIEMAAHPKLTNFFIVKLLTYDRAKDGAVENIKAVIYVMDKPNIHAMKLKVGRETHGVPYGTTFYAGNRPGSGEPISSWLYYEDARIFQSLETAKNALEMDEHEGERETYEILASLHKQA
jgi:hypothetical protein